MRPGVLLSAFLVAANVSAQDAKITFLIKQLSTAKDPRLRAQTCTILGKSGSPYAVAPLCGALKDGEAIVRSAAAGSLGELHLPEAIACLKSALGESDNAVRNALERALKEPAVAIAPTPNVAQGSLYIAIDPVTDKVGTLPPDVVSLAEGLIREKVTSLGAALAPAGENKSAAQTLINKHGLKGYLLRTNLLPNGTSGLKIEILIMTYPDQALQGSWNVKAAGGKYEAQLKAMVPRVVDNAAADLEWKQ